jgi:hypothetical protein
VKFWEDNAAANWTDEATSLAARRNVNVARVFTYLSLAQLRAAEDAEAIVPHPPTSAAIGAASAAILSVYFPADVAEIESELAAQQAAAPWPGAKHEDFDAGKAIGRAAAARIIAYSSGDLIGLTDPALHRRAQDIGCGQEARSRAAASVRVRSFLRRETSSALRRLPRSVRPRSSPRSPKCVRSPIHERPSNSPIAQYWAVNQSPVSTAAMTNLAVGLIRAYRKSDHEAARILFVMNAAAWDALIGCFDAKYHYWFIRPPRRIRRSRFRSDFHRIRRIPLRIRAFRDRQRKCWRSRFQASEGGSSRSPKSESLSALCRHPLSLRHGGRIGAWSCGSRKGAQSQPR